MAVEMGGEVAGMMINKAAAAFALADLPADLDAEAVQRCIEAIVALPAVDVVEVVRCTDCKYWKDEVCYVNENPIDSGATFYCAYGERKEDEE